MSNIKKHENSCDGSYVPAATLTKNRTCKYCGNEFDITDKPKGWMANHVRWCICNPTRNASVGMLIKARECITSKHRKSAGEKIKELHEQGVYKNVYLKKPWLGKTHTEKTKNKIREKALASKHRRLRRKVVEYNGVLMDSTWELELAKRLDELKIKWSRPDPIPWIDEEGITHNYFPDFYLEDYDIFLDPKNPHALKVQKKKIKMLLEQYNNIVIIESLEACKNYTV